MSIGTKVLAVAAGTMVAAGLLAASPASADDLRPTTTTVVVDKASQQVAKGGTGEVTLTATVRSTTDAGPENVDSAPYGDVDFFGVNDDGTLRDLAMGTVELEEVKEVKDGEFVYATATLKIFSGVGKYGVVAVYKPGLESWNAASKSTVTSFEVAEVADPPAEDPPAEDPPAEDPPADDPTADDPTDAPTDGPTTGPVVDPDRSVPGVPGFTG